MINENTVESIEQSLSAINDSINLIAGFEGTADTEELDDISRNEEHLDVMRVRLSEIYESDDTSSDVKKVLKNSAWLGL